MTKSFDLETAFLTIFFKDNPSAMHNYLLGARREMEKWGMSEAFIDKELQRMQEEQEAKLVLL